MGINVLFDKVGLIDPLIIRCFVVYYKPAFHSVNSKADVIEIKAITKYMA